MTCPYWSIARYTYRVGCHVGVTALAWVGVVGQARRCGSSYGRVDDRPAGLGSVGLWSDLGCGRGGDRGAAASAGGNSSAGTTSAVHASGSDAAGRVGEVTASRAVGGVPGYAIDAAAVASGVDRAAV